MNIGYQSFFFEEATQDIGIGSGNLLALEPLQTIIAATFRHSQGETALAEAKRTHHFRILSPFLILVLTDYSEVSHTTCHTLRDVIIAKIKHLDWEVAALYQECSFAAAHLNACFCKQSHCIFEETTLRLDCYSQHLIIYHLNIYHLQTLTKPLTFRGKAILYEGCGFYFGRKDTTIYLEFKIKYEVIQNK